MVAVGALAALVARHAGATHIPMCTDVGLPGSGGSSDDTSQIRGAITAALGSAGSAGTHAVCFQGGTYAIQTDTGGASFDLGHLGFGSSAAVDLSLSGAGPGTTLLLEGSNAGTWYMFLIDHGAAHIHFRDMTLDGSAATATDNQLIHIGANDGLTTDEITLENVAIRNSHNEGMGASGSASSITTTHIAISDGMITGNASQGLDIAAGVENVQVSGTTFAANGSEDIRAHGYPIDGLVLAGNVFVRGGATTTASVSAHGGGSATAESRMVITRNAILNGRIDLLHVFDVAIDDNAIVGGASQATAEILLTGSIDNVMIDDNQIIRSNASSAQNVLFATNGGGESPSDLVVRGNVFVQPSANHIVELQSTSNASVSGNQLVFTSTSTNTFGGIFVRALSSGNDEVVVSHNTIDGSAGSGSLANAIWLANGGATAYITHAVVSGNTAYGCVNGDKFENLWSASPAPVSADNHFACTNADTASTSTPLIVAGNASSTQPVHYVSTGVPSVAAPSGSLWTRRDPVGSGSGSAASVLWVCEGGSAGCTSGGTGWKNK